MGRARIGQCSNPADAALVRSAFEAHDIPVVIGAEQHAGLLGGLGAGFLSLDIWVDEEDAEQAIALLADLRTSEPSGEQLPDDAFPEEDEDAEREVDQRLAVRRGTGIAVLLALCVTFGTAHLYAGAMKRGFAIAAVEVFGIWYLAHSTLTGGLLIGAAIFVDLWGALVRIRAPQPSLPVARVRR